MERIVTVNDKEYRFVANAAMSYLYKQTFKKDLMLEFKRLATSKNGEMPEGLIDDVAEVGFVMAKLGGQENTKSMTEWLSQFSSDEMIRLITPAVITLWKDDNTTSSTPKNSAGPQTEK